MPIPPVTEFAGLLPAENEPATFPARAEALFDWLVGQGMPEFNAAVAALNATLNDNGTVLDTAGKAIALTTNAGTLVVTGGTGNAYTITPAVAVTAYEDGQTFMVRPNRANTGNVTLKVGALAAVPVRKLAANGTSFTELAVGDWQPGEVHVVGYRGGQFEILGVLLNKFVRADAPATIAAPWAFQGDLSFLNPAQVRAALAAASANITIAAGDGLDGGGNLSANRSLNVDATVVRTSRAVNTGDGLQGGGALTQSRTLAVDSTVVRTTRTVATGGGLNGGGSLAANRTIAMNADERMTTANVLAQVAGAAIGAVGSYALLRRSSPTTVDAGTLVLGSSLEYASASGAGGGTPAGTWMTCGRTISGSSESATTLFLRVS